MRQMKLKVLAGVVGMFTAMYLCHYEFIPLSVMIQNLPHLVSVECGYCLLIGEKELQLNFLKLQGSRYWFIVYCLLTINVVWRVEFVKVP